MWMGGASYQSRRMHGSAVRAATPYGTGAARVTAEVRRSIGAWLAAAFPRSQPILGRLGARPGRTRSSSVAALPLGPQESD